MSGSGNPAYGLFSASGTFGAAASVSGAIAVNNAHVVALLVPAGWTTANLRFQGSPDGVTFYPLRDMLGNPMTALITAGEANQIPPAMLSGWPYLRLQSVSTADNVTAVAQGSAITVILSLKKF